jgi:NAD(P)-dependent dehydrogenase (short-subunit alcohol dehydrogenase family)
VSPAGKHAFITGGGSGIGLAVAAALLDAGWRVSIAGRNAERLAAAASAHPGLQTHCLDVTDSQAVEAAMQAAAADSGLVQLLVNNAGGATSAPFEKTSLQSWREALDLNLMGAVHCIRAALPGMKESGWGRIVNVASTAGLVAYRYVSAYVASKHALVGLTKALALEVAKTGVTVNAVCPGYVDTEIVAKSVSRIRATTGRSEEESLKTLIAGNPQGRLIAPKEVAAAVLWLASDDAAAVNGIAFPIAGGEVA